MDSLQVLVLIVPVALQDDVVDALIGLPAVSGFTLSDAAGYSSEHSQFNLSEQVEGSRKFSRLEVVHEPLIFEELCAALEQAFGGQAVRYWLSPVLEQGHLGGDGDND
jgi:hypothetical protein